MKYICKYDLKALATNLPSRSLDLKKIELFLGDTKGPTGVVQ